MRTAGIAAVWLVALSASATSQQLMRPGSPDSVIARQGRRSPRPLWTLALGPALVEDMRWFSPGKLLVGLRQDAPDLPNLDYLLVNADSGTVIWRYVRGRKNAVYQPLAVLDDALVFRADERDRATLIAVDTVSGAERWSRDFKGSSVRFHPLPDVGIIAVENRAEHDVELDAVDRGGNLAWQRRVRFDHAVPGPEAAMIPGGGSLYDGYASVERIAATTGSAVWSRADLTLGEQSPVATIDGDELLLVDASNTLVAMDTTTGATKWSVRLEQGQAFTTIYPAGDRVYLPAVLGPAAAAALGTRYALVALSRAERRILWTYASQDLLTSNLVEDTGRLFAATSDSLFALDRETGTRAWGALAAESGRLYPVHLRLVGGHIAYISELSVTAFDPATGSRLWSQGMTPVSSETSLSGLDASVPRLRDEVAGLRGATPRGPSPAGIMARGALSEGLVYQRMAESYGRLSEQAWQEYRQTGNAQDYLSSRAYGIQSDLNAHWAKLQQMTSVALGLTDLVLSFRRRIQIGRAVTTLETTIERQELFRRSIIAAYARGEDARYVARPNERFTTGANDFTTLSVVDLRTGRRRDAVLSPTYLSYGLWNLVDFDRGVVYHHGIGLDPSRYQYGDPHKLYPYGEIRSINTFLIAVPLQMPPSNP